MGVIDIHDAIVAAAILESALYGFFLLLSFISLYAMLQLGRRAAPTAHYPGCTVPGLSPCTWYAIKRPMFIGGFSIMMTVSAHWISSVVQVFQVLHHTKAANPNDVISYLFDPSHTTQLVKNILLVSSPVVGNVVIVHYES
ncbi:hypothetical protein PM082_020684 [Marasmius tenuissimus]|nr:hypothetical protein PM082_020684 [Marasmius tenuissimus]